MRLVALAVGAGATVGPRRVRQPDACPPPHHDHHDVASARRRVRRRPRARRRSPPAPPRAPRGPPHDDHLCRDDRMQPDRGVGRPDDGRCRHHHRSHHAHQQRAGDVRDERLPRDGAVLRHRRAHRGHHGGRAHGEPLACGQRSADRGLGCRPRARAQFNYQYSDVPVGSETSCPTSEMAEVTAPGGQRGLAELRAHRRSLWQRDHQGVACLRLVLSKGLPRCRPVPLEDSAPTSGRRTVR